MLLRLLAVAVALPLVASAPECPAGSIPGKHGVATCCPAACFRCGGRGCEERAGGRQACCALDVQKAGRPCNGTAPPCVPQGRAETGEMPIKDPLLTWQLSETNMRRCSQVWVTATLESAEEIMNGAEAHYEFTAVPARYKRTGLTALTQAFLWSDLGRQVG